MKKFISVVLAFFLLSTFTLPCFAAYAANDDGELYTYVDADGKSYDYYLDEDGNAYNYVDGEKIYMLLPLSQYRITDEALLAELNKEFSVMTRDMSMPEPKEYFDISNIGNEITSSAYVKDVSFDNFQTFTTPWIKISPHHTIIHFRTTNIKKPLFGSKKVYVVVRLYHIDEGYWTQNIYKKIDCSSKLGYKFLYLTQHRYCQFALGIPEDVTGYTANIWTTAG